MHLIWSAYCELIFLLRGALEEIDMGEISLYLGEVCEISLEYVLHIGRVDGVSVGAIRHGDFEGFEALLEIRKDPVMHRVEVLQRLYCRCDEGPLFRSHPLPLLSPVHP